MGWYLKVHSSHIQQPRLLIEAAHLSPAADAIGHRGTLSRKIQLTYQADCLFSTSWICSMAKYYSLRRHIIRENSLQNNNPCARPNYLQFLMNFPVRQTRLTRGEGPEAR